jgi:methylenetetrahydrofolate reductase (NADPH)
MTRIIDKIVARRKEHAKSRVLNGAASTNATPGDNASSSSLWYYSFEFFPPKTEPGLENLLTRIDRMCRRYDPLFISITWGANGSTLSRSLAIAAHAQRFACVDVLLHISCTGLTREKIAQVLQMAKSSGIRNILALRGDPPRGKRSWNVNDVSGGECDRAIDLVKLIREIHGEYFCIGVAGHPEGHPSSMAGEEGREVELRHLKEKMDAGADFIITQFFYDVHVFMEYVMQCRKVDINAPILPGIMPIQSYSSLIKMTQFCGISVPESVHERLHCIQHDDEAVKKVGCEIATEMCQTILSNSQEIGSDVDGFHFYTLNLERSTTRILIELDAVDTQTFSRSASPTFLNAEDGEQQQPENMKQPRSEIGDSISEKVTSTRRLLPWKPSTMENRSKEAVRPINWSNRPHSYVMRTDDWDEVRKEETESCIIETGLCTNSPPATLFSNNTSAKNVTISFPTDDGVMLQGEFS